MRSNISRVMGAWRQFYAKSIANLKSHSLSWVTVYAWSAKNWQRRLLTWWTRKFYLRSDGLAAYYYTCMKKQMRNIGKWNHIEHYLISRYSKFSQERFTMPNEKSSPGARTQDPIIQSTFYDEAFFNGTNRDDRKCVIGFRASYNTSKNKKSRL